MMAIGTGRALRFAVVFTALLFANACNGQPARAESLIVEPPSWWIGMAEPMVELMIRAENAAQFDVSIVNRSDVRIVSVARPDTPNTLFVTLDIPADAAVDHVLFEFRYRGVVVAQRSWELWVRSPGSAERSGFGPSDIIYLVFPDRFANGDPGNDSIPGMREQGVDRTDDYARHGGDLAGLMQRLEWISELGMTAMWLTPVLEMDSVRTSYHGYGATDLYAIDPRFGSNEDYFELSTAADGFGLKLIKDIVLNHVGVEHPWVADPPTSTWFNRTPDGGHKITNHLRTTLTDPYAATVDRAGFADGWFVDTMPDLNQRDPHLARYLIQHSIWWIERAFLAGVRLDTYPYADNAFVGQWMDRILREYPNLNVVGEEWSLNPLVVATWQRPPQGLEPARDPGAPPPALAPSLMDFPLHDQFVRSLTAPDAWNSGWLPLYEFMVNDRLYPNPNGLTTILDNHDMDRIHTQLGKDPALTKMAMAYLLTMRGVPQVFYGTEVLIANDKPGDHGDIRRDMPGGWAGDAVDLGAVFAGAEVRADGLSADQADMLAYTRALATWRRGARAVHEGRLVHFAPDAHGPGPYPHRHIYAYARILGDGPEAETVFVALNKAETPVRLELDRFAEVLGGKTRVRDVVTGGMWPLADGITVPPRAALVLEIE